MTEQLRTEIDRWFEKRGGEMIDDTLSLINISSVCGAPEPGAPFGRTSRNALDFSRELLSKLGIETRVFNDCVAVGETDKGEPELGILVHVDVVGANGDEWSSDPFAGVIRDGEEYGKTEPIIYGRGAADNKGPAVAAFYALQCASELNGGLKKPAQIIVGSAEELGCIDVNKYRETHPMPPNTIAPDACFPLVNVEKGRFTLKLTREWVREDTLPRVISIDGGSTINIIPGTASAVIEGLSGSELAGFSEGFAEKTGTKFTVVQHTDGVCTVTVTGTAAHASLPWEGNNAQTALLSMLAALPLAKSSNAETIRELARLFPHGDYYGKQLGINCSDELSGDFTLAFDVLSLDETGMSAAFDCRTPMAADSVDLDAFVRNNLQTAGFQISGTSRILCHHTPAGSPLVKTLLGIYSQYTGETDVNPLVRGGMTYVHGLPGGVAFGPELPGIDSRIHGRDEFIGVNHLLLMAKMYAAAIISICG